MAGQVLKFLSQPREELKKFKIQQIVSYCIFLYSQIFFLFFLFTLYRVDHIKKNVLLEFIAFCGNLSSYAHAYFVVHDDKFASVRSW